MFLVIASTNYGVQEILGSMGKGGWSAALTSTIVFLLTSRLARTAYNCPLSRFFSRGAYSIKPAYRPTALIYDG